MVLQVHLTLRLELVQIIIGDCMEKVNELEAIIVLLKAVLPTAIKILCFIVVIYVSNHILPIYIKNQGVIDIVSFLLVSIVAFFSFRKQK
ncbi:hypothetical protein QQ14_09415 [Salmonella enterica subsp. enterica]|uniref:Uncharacterized protein n=2 Tax=Salmonella enterica TaxID=28901 RepID=A0A3R0Q281_SALER|nr:hypothetical protein [Salmonella enterica]EBH8100607.1 hypothetical protein [Salmonella enterica subsp. houtenae serovar O:11:g,z25:-]ECH8280008.1 hypothetical protein [Salmonella enterica subsp. enterica]ECI4040534.1 hypothetical protein [Salmonella enterica subsp. houtenae]ECT3984154.1 hypothetical protein [Salmonella enterica subsp. houtenae serovar 53:z4,z23:-]ECT8750146.1 hypothetical protein [Salmonella enterica subsp. enterica serovar Adelaide]ESE92420.1 hypothetical protein SEH5013